MSEQQRSGQSAAELFGSDRMWGLKELPLPEPVSWWPQAPGWYFLGSLILVAMLWLCYRFYKRYRANQYRRDGLSNLDLMGRDVQLLKTLPQLLRYSALQSAPRQSVASLAGARWAAWLNESANDELFSIDDVELLEQLAYRPGYRQELDPHRIDRLIEASKKWMKSHRAAV